MVYLGRGNQGTEIGKGWKTSLEREHFKCQNEELKLYLSAENHIIKLYLRSNNPAQKEQKTILDGERLKCQNKEFKLYSITENHITQLYLKRNKPAKIKHKLQVEKTPGKIIHHNVSNDSLQAEDMCNLCIFPFFFTDLIFLF